MVFFHLLAGFGKDFFDHERISFVGILGNSELSVGARSALMITGSRRIRGERNLTNNAKSTGKRQNVLFDISLRRYRRA